jgi:hypothetical protein
MGTRVHVIKKCLACGEDFEIDQYLADSTPYCWGCDKDIDDNITRLFTCIKCGENNEEEK